MLAHIVKKWFFVVLFLTLFLAVAFGFALAQESPDLPQTPHQGWMEAVLTHLDRYQFTPDLLLHTRAGKTQQPIPQAPSTMGVHNRLVYQSLAAGDWDIYYVAGSGGVPQVLGRTSDSEIHPRLNRGATRVAFASDRTGSFEIFIVNPDGSNFIQATGNDYDDVNPGWSPDGQKIAFESYRDGQPEIYIMNADGSGETRLTNHPSYDGMPTWTPDGTQLTFVSFRDGIFQIYNIAADGSNEQRMVTPVHSLYPSWSPTGEQLAFSGDQYNDGWLDVWTIDQDGTNLQPRWYAGQQHDGWIGSWVENAPEWSVYGTVVNYIYYAGNWYWTEGNLVEWTLHGGSVGTSQLPMSDGVSWNPDVVSTDATAPVMPPFAIPQYARRVVHADWQPATDTGTGTYGYDVQVREYPNGSWENVSHSPLSQLNATVPGGKRYYFRVRAMDGAYNFSEWFYTSSVTVYGWALNSQVSDNRGFPLYDVAVTTEPASFRAFEIESGNHMNYVGSVGNIYSGQWSLDGYGQALSTMFPGNTDTTAAIVLPPENNVISDGGFESGGLQEWNVNEPTLVSVNNSDNHTGSHHLDFDSQTTTELAISQTVTIAVNMPNPTLSFFYRFEDDGTGGDAGLEVELAWDQSTQTIFTASSETDGWQHTWKDLSPWVGESVTMTFRRPAGNPLLVMLDDVSLGSTSSDLWLGDSGALAALPGETVIRTLHYGNHGGVGAPGTGITLTLPAELTLVNASPAPTGTGPLYWDLGDIPAGESGSIVLTLTMSSTASMLDTTIGQVELATEYEAYTVNNDVDLAFLVGRRLLLPLFVRG